MVSTKSGNIDDLTDGFVDISTSEGAEAVKQKILSLEDTSGSNISGMLEYGEKILGADTAVQNDHKIVIMTSDLAGYVCSTEQGGTLGAAQYDKNGRYVGNDAASYNWFETSTTAEMIDNLVKNEVLTNSTPIPDANKRLLEGYGETASYFRSADTCFNAQAIALEYETQNPGNNVDTNNLKTEGTGRTQPQAMEVTAYKLGKCFQRMKALGYNMHVLTIYYKNQGSERQLFAQAIGDWIAEKKLATRYDCGAGKAAEAAKITDAFSNITADIKNLCRKATLYDEVNSNYFELKSGSMEVLYDGIALTATPLANGSTGYGTVIEGSDKYQYELTIDGSKIKFDINKPVDNAHLLQLRFIEKLKVPTDTVAGMTVETNMGDCHLEFMSATDYANNPNAYTKRFTYKSPSVSFAAKTEGASQFLVTFLDCSGNTVKIEWVPYGHSATAPTGYGTYEGYTNVTAHIDLKPIDCKVGYKFDIVNTGVK